MVNTFTIALAKIPLSEVRLPSLRGLGLTRPELDDLSNTVSARHTHQDPLQGVLARATGAMALNRIIKAMNREESPEQEQPQQLSRRQAA